jgi:hypothetical protein
LQAVTKLTVKVEDLGSGKCKIVYMGGKPKRPKKKVILPPAASIVTARAILKGRMLGWIHKEDRSTGQLVKTDEAWFKLDGDYYFVSPRGYTIAGKATYEFRPKMKTRWEKEFKERFDT